MKKKLMCLLMIMVFIISGCGSSSSDTAVTAESTASAADYGNGGYSKYAYEEPAEEAAAEEMGEELSSTDELIENGRKLIKTVWMNMETEDFDATLSALEAEVAQVGGYIENSNIYYGSSTDSSNRSADLTVRVPSKSLNAFTGTMEGIGNVTRKNESVEDVTLQYVDLESHKAALETEQERLLDLLSKAETMEEIIALESRLSEVRYQIQSMESSLRTYDNQIDYSTVYFDISEVERYTPPVEKGVWERIATGFTENLYMVGEGLVDFFVGFVVSLPVLFVLFVFFGIFGLIIWLIVKNVNRRNERKMVRPAQQMPKQGAGKAGTRPDNGKDNR